MLIALAIVLNYVLWWVIGPNFEGDGHWSFGMLLFNFCTVALESIILVELSLAYEKLLFRFFSNRKQNQWTTLLHTITLFALNIVTVFIVTKLWNLIGGPAPYEFFLENIYVDTVVISVLSSAWMASEWERKATEEKLVTLQAKMDMLSLQTNNHFMFNCLSTAYGMVHTDPDGAEKFIYSLSKIFRYLTSNSGKHFVSLSEELSFLEEYGTLLSYRYPDISLTVDPSLSAMECVVAPAAIQSLVENAVKHNSHVGLSIKLSRDGDFIAVKNPKLPLQAEEKSTGTGLKNLNDRYLLGCGKKIVVKDGQDTFEVSVPIVYCEDINESADN